MQQQQRMSNPLVDKLVENLRQVDSTATQICQNIERNPRYYSKRKKLGIEKLLEVLSDMKLILRKDVMMPLMELMERDGVLPAHVIQELTKTFAQLKEMLNYLETRATITIMGVKKKSSYYHNSLIENLGSEIQALLAQCNVAFPQFQFDVDGHASVTKRGTVSMDISMNQTTTIDKQATRTGLQTPAPTVQYYNPQGGY